ncbi:MAG: helix-turn-helix transcriptional regulator [bacterium]
MRITKTDLLLLALLDKAPAYAWRLDELLREMRADLWAEYSRPHLYYALRKLEREGYAELVGSSEQELRRIYALTEKGRALLVSHEAGSELAYEHTAFSFDLLLGFAESFGAGRDDFSSLLEARREALERELEATQELWRSAEIAGDLQFGRLAVIRHRIKFLKSELDFLKWLEKSAPAGWQSLSDRAGE